MCVDSPSQVLSQKELTGSNSLKVIGHLIRNVEFYNKNRPIKQPKYSKQDKDFSDSNSYGYEDLCLAGYNAEFSICFLLVICLICSSILKMEAATYLSETLVLFLTDYIMLYISI
jgi:hypothetical protein